MQHNSGKSAKGGWVRTDAKLTGKSVLITGANTGIGLETAIDLAKREARVIIACRNLEKAEAAKTRIIEESGSEDIVVKHLDLASFASIRLLAEDINATEKRLDILINNAGLLVPAFKETEDGIEMHFGVNHLGHFLLTNLLIDLLKKCAPSRIVNVSSVGHGSVSMNWNDLQWRTTPFKGMEVYCQSKLMNVLFSRELSKRLSGKGVTSNSLHPGLIQTEFARNSEGCCVLGGSIGFVTGLLFTSKCCLPKPRKGAQTTIYCAVAPELKEITGKYFDNCKIKTESIHASNDESAKRLWELSEELTGMRTTI